VLEQAKTVLATWLAKQVGAPVAESGGFERFRKSYSPGHWRISKGLVQLLMRLLRQRLHAFTMPLRRKSDAFDRNLNLAASRASR